MKYYVQNCVESTDRGRKNEQIAQIPTERMMSHFGKSIVASAQIYHNFTLLFNIEIVSVI